MSKSSTAFALPFLTAPDPAVSGEGAIDPLGFATVGDRLADWFLPGMTARMIRPRFLTAIAVSAVVCEGMEEEIAADRVTPVVHSGHRGNRQHIGGSGPRGDRPLHR